MPDSLHTWLDRDTRTLTISGAFGHDDLGALSGAISEALTKLPDGLVLDLTDLDQLPPSALFALFMAADTHRETPVQLRARAGSPAALVLAGNGDPDRGDLPGPPLED